MSYTEKHGWYNLKHITAKAVNNWPVVQYDLTEFGYFLGHKLNSLLIITEKSQGILLEITGMALMRPKFLISTMLGC